MSGHPAATGPRRLSPWTTTRCFVRAFTIQGSWNYRTMIGNGFAFSLLPVLRSLYRDGQLEEAVRRHADHFNAHPYLANVALGAAARMEAEGRDEELIRRFKVAVKGPLGGLGDTLVWATMLPTTMLIALVLAWSGAPAWLAVGSFLVLYNVGHLALRVWGFRLGLREGKDVAVHLKRMGLGGRAEDLARGGSLLVGLLLGLVGTVDPGLSDPRWLWVPLAAVAFGVGLVGGHKVWRPAALAVVGSVVAVCVVNGLLS